jgi:molybdopterin/thiamine biosynthesis adenylyltransferase/rhodanese-related sulfurtransferase/molybdopterin converting factor small subunit
MAVTVRIPTPLRTLTAGADEVSVPAANVRSLIDALEERHRGIKGQLCDADGKLRRFVNLYLNDEDIRFQQGLDTPLKNGDVVAIIPAIAGGSPAPTWPELLKRLKQEIPEVSPEESAAARRSGKALIVDVRDKEEYNEGHIEGAVHLPRSFLEMKAEAALSDREAPIIVHCAGGVRSLLAAESLRRLGYTNVRSMAGGFAKWKDQGLPFVKPRALGEFERKRYSRHLSIPEVGEAGQIKLLDAKVLLVGAGGLGSPAALYLAAAGVGTLGIVDFDVVDESNLQRQILHTTERVGQPKTESARQALVALNPKLEVRTFEERLSSANVERIFRDFDVVLDGSDNFPTRYLVNDACVLLKKPNVHGSVYRFEGQVTIFWPGKGPCYRCLYPEPPPAELAPSCAEAGVLGVLPGVVGLLEAVEAIKIILGKGQPLTGRLLTYDALKAEFRELKLRRDPNCRYCRDGAPFPGFIDYEQFCAAPSAAAETAAR